MTRGDLGVEVRCGVRRDVSGRGAVVRREVEACVRRLRPGSTVVGRREVVGLRVVCVERGGVARLVEDVLRARRRASSSRRIRPGSVVLAGRRTAVVPLRSTFGRCDVEGRVELLRRTSGVVPFAVRRREVEEVTGTRSRRVVVG